MTKVREISSEAQDMIDEINCRSIAEVALERLKEAAQEASVNSLLLAAKLEADKKHGKARPDQVAGYLAKLLNALSEFVDNSKALHEALREREEEAM